MGGAPTMSATPHSSSSTFTPTGELSPSEMHLLGRRHQAPSHIYACVMPLTLLGMQGRGQLRSLPRVEGHVRVQSTFPFCPGSTCHSVLFNFYFYPFC